MFIRDTAERKLAEENQARFIQALDEAPEGIVFWDAEDRFVMTNERFQKLQPTSSDLLRPGMTYKKFVRERLKSGEINQAKGKEDEWVEQRMKNHQQKFQDAEIQRHGRWLHVRENRLADGSTIQFYGDITERKQAEEMLKETQARLEDAFNSISGGAGFSNQVQHVRLWKKASAGVL